MLHLTIKKNGYTETPFSDIDKIFAQTRIKDTPLVRQLIHEIEQGTYHDSYRFIDRFGVGVRMQDLSTGCKAALIMASGYTAPLDLTECGKNAISAIIRNCKSGTIALVDDMTFSNYVDGDDHDECEIEFDGYKFTSIDRLNYYITDEWQDCHAYGEEPDFTMPGIEKLAQ